MRSRSTCRIALVQVPIHLHDLSAAFRDIERFMKRARGKADIIVFPEYILSWHFIDTRGIYLKRFQTLARNYRLAIVPGSFLVREGKKTYNTTYYISAQGALLGTYRKIHLWMPEQKRLSPGKRVCVCDTPFGKIGLALCWDLAFDDHYKALVKKGAQIVICPAFWGYDETLHHHCTSSPRAERSFIDGCCLSRAYEHELIHVFCNACGAVHQGKTCIHLTGHSQITAPLDGVLEKMTHSREALVISHLDLRILKQAEHTYRLRSRLKSV